MNEKRFVYTVELTENQLRKFERFCLLEAIWFKLKNSFTLVEVKNE